MNMRLKEILLIIIGTVGYSVWAFMAYQDPSVRAGFLALNMSMVGGTIGLVLRDMQTPTSVTSAIQQAAPVPAIQVLPAPAPPQEPAPAVSEAQATTAQ